MKNIRLQYAGWDDLPPDFQSFFHFLLGADTQKGRTFYELYFLWFSIPHEIAHVLRELHGLTDSSHWADEIAATAFAAAYWRQRGEQQRLKTLSEMLRAVLKRLPDPVPATEERGTFFDLNYDRLVQSATRFGHYMFSMALAAIEAPSDWIEVLNALISPSAVDAEHPPIGPYAAVNEFLPRQIVLDMDEYLRPHGIAVPDMAIECAFDFQLQYVTWE